MDGLAPLVLEVFDKDFAYQGTVARPQALAMTAKHNAVGGGAFVLDSDDEMAEALVEPGMQTVCWYRYDPEDPQALMYFVGGPVSQVDLAGSLAAPTRAFTLVDHWDLLTTFPCRAVPASAGWASQGDSATFYTSTGPAETVVKDLISQNLELVPTPITVEATHGWGEDITVQVRDNALVDRIFPAMDYAHVGISVRQGLAGLVVDAYQPTVHAVPLTAESGILTKVEGSLLRPTVSRVTVRGGEDPSTVRRLVVNAAVEAVWGYCGWAQVEVPESTTPTYLDAKGWEVLNAASRQASLTIELAETDDWRFGRDEGFFDLGDEVPLRIAGITSPITETIREVEIAWSKGLTVTPRAGSKPAEPNAVLAKSIQQVAAMQRVMRARG